MIRVEHNIIGMCATNTYYVFDDATKKAIIVDPAGDPMRIIDRVAKLGVTPAAILITHGHFDHILALDEIREHFNIKAYAGLTEKAVLKDPKANLTAGFLGESITREADVYLRDGEEFEAGGYRIKALEVPGHTIGGMCYYFADYGIVFSGDTLFCESVGRTDFPGGSTLALIGAVKEKLYTLPDETIVYPGHSESTTIAHEKKYNPFVR